MSLLRRPSVRGLLKIVLVSMTAVLVMGAVVVARPVWHIFSAWRADIHAVAPGARGTVNDASKLNRTRMNEVIAVPPDRDAAEKQLKELLARAAREQLRVSVAGARHSMGGHTIYPGGIAVNMLPFNHMSLDDEANLLTVGAGARWSEILPYLNERGRSVAVMQSNNSFSVGGSISVNCHGWQTGKPPICSTVKSLRLMRADGNIVKCSRTENPELFSLVLGGYGLFGIILDVDLHVVPNEMLRLERVQTSIGDYAKIQREKTATDTDAVLAYGRLDVTMENLLSDALLNVWKRDSTIPCTTASMGVMSLPAVRRAIFRGSVGDAYGKTLRWWAEQNLSPFMGSDCRSRNELLNVGVELFENRSTSSTDILHEYFIPPDQFAAFVNEARALIKDQKADLLNVTVRDVQPDTDTFLRYADQRMLCLVMLFNQQKTAAGEAEMEMLTQDLIDAALAVGGRYYLTYRLHATQSQIRKAYPNIDEFFAKKREYDPPEIFQNEFYRKYGRTISAAYSP